ncbi:hypothetical protein ACQP3L_37825 [Escherichia coli]
MSEEKEGHSSFNSVALRKKKKKLKKMEWNLRKKKERPDSFLYAD